jgi:23S rRNA maturation mini-RNase III
MTYELNNKFGSQEMKSDNIINAYKNSHQIEKIIGHVHMIEKCNELPQIIDGICSFCEGQCRHVH